MSETTKIQQLIDQQAKKQVDQEASDFIDLVIGYLADRPIRSYSFGALQYEEISRGILNKNNISPGCDSAEPFKQALLKFVSDWKKVRFERIQSEMTNDLLQKVNLLTPTA